MSICSVGCAGAPVIVVQSHHVIQFRRGNLEEGSIFDRLEPVLFFRGQPEAEPGQSFGFDQHPVVIAYFQQGFPFLDIECLILFLMVLEAETMSFLDEEDFTSVVRCESKQKLVAPGFLRHFR